MKNMTISAVVSILFILTGCSREVTQTNVPLNGQSIISAFTERHASTRTSLNNSKVLWTAGDEIAVFALQGASLSVYTLTEGAGTTAGKFTGTSQDASAKYAYYPACQFYSTEFYNDGFSLTLPRIQDYSNGSFGVNSNPMAAKMDESGNFEFKNLCGAIRLSLTGTEVVKRISISGPYDCLLSGYAEVDISEPDYHIILPSSPYFSIGDNEVSLSNIYVKLEPDITKEFTIVVPAQTYNDLRILVTTDNGDEMVAVASNPITVNRSRVAPIENLQFTSVNFPDPLFRSLLKYDYGFVMTPDESDIDINNKDNQEKFRTLTEINVPSFPVVTIKGIEYFTGLETLSIESFLLKSLDMTRNIKLKKLNCSEAILETIDLTNNPLLEVLNCANNRLTELDVTRNPKLKYLSCGGNMIHTLDITQNSELISLNFSYLKNLNLNIGNLNKLQILGCSGWNSPMLNDIIAQNQGLTELYCSECELTELDLSRHNELKLLICYNNPLNRLNVNKLTKLRGLNCVNCELTELDLTDNINLSALFCSGNMLATIDLTKLATTIPKENFGIGSQWKHKYSKMQKITVYVTQAQKDEGLVYENADNSDVVLIVPGEY